MGFPLMAASLPSSLSDHGWLRELQALLLDTDGLSGFLDQLADLTARALPEGSSCGVTVRSGFRPATLAASDDLTRRVDQLQYDLDEGPCLDTLDSGQSNYIPDTSGETRWPEFCRGAHHEGVWSVLSLPLSGPVGVLGGYNLYATHRDAFPSDLCGQVEVFAGNAAGALAVAVKLAEQAQLSEDLREALTSRAVIDQATGIAMAQQRCDAENAFAMLRRISQQRNLKLRDLATEIVTAVGGRAPAPGHFEPRD